MQHFSSHWLMMILIMGGLSTYVCVASFISDILPYKKDADSEVKQKVPYIVSSKGYNSLTDEYFVTLERLDRTYVVDEETYNDATKGEQILMSQAVKSKYIFSLKNSFTPFVSF